MVFHQHPITIYMGKAPVQQLNQAKMRRRRR